MTIYCTWTPAHWIGLPNCHICVAINTTISVSEFPTHPVLPVQHLWVQGPEQLDQTSGRHHHIYGREQAELVILCRLKITHTHRCLLLKRFSSSWTQEALTLVFVSLVLGQILQQVLVDGQRTAARHLLDGVETTQKKWGGVKDSAGI